MPRDDRGETSGSASPRLRRVNRLSPLGFALAVTVLIAVPNLLLHLPATSLDSIDRGREADVLAQLRFLQEANAAGAAHDMQRLYPEGFFFQHVLTGLAWSDLGLGSVDVPLRQEAATAARSA